MFLTKFFKNVGNFLSGIFNKMEKVAQVAIVDAIKITNGLKEFDAAHPIVGTLLETVTGHLGTEVVGFMRANLTKICTDLRVADSIANNPDENVKVKALLDIAQNLTGNARSAALKEISAFIAIARTDGKLSIDNALLGIMAAYTHNLNLDPKSIPAMPTVPPVVPAATK